jgi:hypothetical protein
MLFRPEGLSCPHTYHTRKVQCATKRKLQMKNVKSVKNQFITKEYVNNQFYRSILTYVEQGQEIAPASHNWYNPQAKNNLALHQQQNP